MSDENYNANFEHYSKVRGLISWFDNTKDKIETFPIIRQYYKLVWKDIMMRHVQGRIFHRALLPFEKYFSPIEFGTWQDLTAGSLPFVPEYPVLNYFIDFADPCRKIGIECDGKQWHDANKDAKRDDKLKAIGWTIFRFTGAQILRIPPPKVIDEMNDIWREKSQYEKD